MAVFLFSYGTLQQPGVQLANFGRLLNGRADAIRGYRLEPLKISDPRVIKVSGRAVHMIACPSGSPNDRIEGMVFEMSQEELEATDAYEVDAYGRVEVTLESGRKGWVYVATSAG